MMGINFLKPTNTQTTWKTIRGMVTKNLIALMLTGHPLGLIENLIHTPVDWIVNKKFCTDNKLLNVGVHLATCLSVDSLIHGTGHEIAETLMSDGGGHVHGSVSSDIVGGSDTSNDIDSFDTDSIATDVPDDTDVGDTIENPSIDEMSKGRGGIWAAMDQMDHGTHFVGDGHNHTAELVGGGDDIGDAHAGHSHGDGHNHEAHGEHAVHTEHDHEHGGHGILPILGGAIVEEYGPTMYKITKKRTQGLLSRMFNYDTGSDTKIVKKSELAVA